MPTASDFYLFVLALYMSSLFTPTLPAQSRLVVMPDRPLLMDSTGRAVLLHGDTGWNLGIRLDREEIDTYLRKRQNQKFNTIGMAALFEGNLNNVYGDAPFGKTDGKWDPAKIEEQAGNNPEDTTAYDYWDHIDYAVERVDDHGMYLAFVIAFNAMIVGNGRGKNREAIVFDERKAYDYGRYMGRRYGHHDHILWMMGGDRSPVYGEFDYQPVYHAMAEGVADGIKGEDDFDGEADYTGILISYHPQKARPASSEWFHDAEWNSFNSIQACPADQVPTIQSDLALTPQKPTWLFEGRYEEYTFAYKAWHIRYQAYQSLMAGAFGHLYGNRYVWNYDTDWERHLDDPGAWDMMHLYDLFANHLPAYSWDDWRPHPALLDVDDTGGVENICWRSATTAAPTADFVTAMRTTDGRSAIVYAANGRNFTLDTAELKGPPTAAYWYSPRTGHWYDPADEREHPTRKNILSEEAKLTFDPPGEPGADNDWVLIVETEKQPRHHEPTDIRLRASRDYENPYREVEVTATFTGPEEERISTRAFWDGGRDYTVRFTPTAPGEWRYETSSNVNDDGLRTEGELTVSEGNAPGFVRRDPDRPYHFVHDDGTPYFMFGTTYYDLMMNAMAGERWRKAIDSAHHYGINKLRVCALPMNSEKSFYPFISGFAGSHPDSLDTDRLQLAYWRKLDTVIAYAAARDVKVDLMPFGTEAGYYAADTTDDEGYLRYLIARYAAYPNVVWTLVNEWNYRTRVGVPKPYWNRMGRLLESEDPWQKDQNGAPRHLSVHQQTRIDWQFGNYDWPSHVIIQLGVRNGQGTMEDEWDLNNVEQPAYREGDAWGNAGILFNRQYGMPVVNDEFGYIGEPRDRAAAAPGTDKEDWPRLTRRRHRNILWGIYLAGGYGSAGDKNKYADGHPYFSANWHPAPEYDDIRHLVDFFTEGDIPYRRMTPNNDLVDGERVYALAEEESHYLFYDAVGQNLQAILPPGNYRMTTLDPATGHRQTHETVVATEAATTLPTENPGKDRLIHLSR